MRKTITILALAGLAALAAVTTACPRNQDGTPRVTSEQIKGGARVVRAVADEFVKELDADVESGDVRRADADAVRPIVREVSELAGRLADDRRDLDRLTRGERRRLVIDFVSALNDSAGRLNDAGALHLKSEKARAHFDKVARGISRGLALANIVLAALPPEPARQ